MNSKDEHSTTGLMWAVQMEHNSILKLLLEQPTLDLNCTDNDGYTALHCAIDYGNVEAVQMLLVDPRLTAVNHKNKADETAVMFAMTNRNWDALRVLVFHPNVDLDTRDGQGTSLKEVAR